MDRLKRARKPLRMAVTKTIAEVESEISKVAPDAANLQERLQKLEQLEMRLAEADTKILEELLETTDEEYELEFCATEEYNDKIRSAKTKIRSILGPSNSTQVETETSGDALRKFKLPKIELKKFSGHLQDWLGWWSQFEKIHSDDTLHCSDKFQYLVQATVEGSRARRLVDGYPQTAANYPKAISALKDRFGDTTMLTELYVRKLAGLVIANASKPKSTSLGVMFDELESSLRSLESLGITADQSAAFLYPLVESSLPQDVLKVWQRSPLSGYDSEEDKKVDERLQALMKFLRREVRGEERLSFVTAGITAQEKHRKPYSKMQSSHPHATAAGLVTVEAKCIFCDKSHESRDCAKVMSWALEERKKRVEERRCCYVCLKPGHTAKKCKAFVKCQVCGKRHLVLLCPEISKVKPSEESNEKVPVQNAMSSVAGSSRICLQTFHVVLCGPRGKRNVRALLDSGSQRSYVVTDIANEIGLPIVDKEKMSLAVFGGSVSHAQIYPVFKATIKGTEGSVSSEVKLIGQSRICSAVPVMPLDIMRSLNEMGFKIHDSDDEIQVLIGADHYSNLLTGRTNLAGGNFLMMETKFGWTATGDVGKINLRPNQNTVQSEKQSMGQSLVNACLNVAEVSKLWELDTIGIRDSAQVISEEAENQAAYDSFLKTVTQERDGRYMVALPWKSEAKVFQSNKPLAVQRLNKLTKSLNANQFCEYEKVFDNWKLESLIDHVEGNNTGKFFLPHRPVWKPGSSTPVRPVFDASAKNGRNPSLNDLLYKGPNFMQLIPSILLRFRMHEIGVSADIRKAFQMLVVRPEDRPYLSFLWWNKESQIQEFQHTRVVFGVKSSPFLLAAVLRLHLSNHENREVADKLLNSFYVDNCVCSLSSHEELEIFKREATHILSQAQMELRQWEFSFGDESGIGSLNSRERGLDSGIDDSQDEQVSTSTTILGVAWDKKIDCLSCITPKTEEVRKVTKRLMLSLVSQVYDPIGLLSPFTLLPKLMLQEAWLSKLGWEDEVSKEVRIKFMTWLEQIPELGKIQVPRRALVKGKWDGIELHIFCDASAYAYGTVIYVKSWNIDNCEVNLVAAKSRVSPIKRLTIPRSELLACVIGARLYDEVVKAFGFEQAPSYFWTDSSCALVWIKKYEAWGTFVFNRVEEIRTITGTEQWRHVPG